MSKSAARFNLLSRRDFKLNQLANLEERLKMYSELGATISRLDRLRSEIFNKKQEVSVIEDKIMELTTASSCDYLVDEDMPARRKLLFKLNSAEYRLETLNEKLSARIKTGSSYTAILPLRRQRDVAQVYVEKIKDDIRALTKEVSRFWILDE